MVTPQRDIEMYKRNSRIRNRADSNKRNEQRGEHDRSGGKIETNEQNQRHYKINSKQNEMERQTRAIKLFRLNRYKNSCR